MFIPIEEEQTMKRKIFKLTSVLLAMLLLTSQLLGTIAFANSSYEITDFNDLGEYEVAVSYLDMLGLSYECDQTLPVTRGYAVNSIVSALGLKSVAMSGNKSYSDYEKMANVAHGLGILSGSNPSEWSLDSSVTPAQLCKMFVIALGYGSVISGENAYPTQYISQASRLGIAKHFNNINADSVSYEEFVVMMYYAMNATVLKTVGVSGTDFIYSQNENYTLGSAYLDALKLTKDTGVVEADYYCSADISEKCQLSQIKIGGNYFACDSAKCKDLVGMNVEFVYANESSNVVGINSCSVPSEKVTFIGV